MGDSIVYAIKIALAVACTTALVVAIVALTSLMISLTTSTILGEIFGLISVYLPFNASLVFGSISAGIVAIISFLVAHKVWDLTGATYKMAS